MGSAPLSRTVQEIKAALLEFHRSRGYKIFEPAPLVSGDPTVMFVNATITPFKSHFSSSTIQPENYALIQGCLRMGGSSELEIVGVNPYYLTFFEMFGSGTFNTTHEKATAYLLELLAVLGIKKECLYFTVPVNKRFHKALRQNGVEKTRIFQLTENKYFWQEWKFGVPGPVGYGLTVVFARSSQKVESVEQLAGDQDRYVELLNLIHIHSQSLPDGKLVPISNPGFDLGVGVERLAAVLQGCDSYHIDTVLPLVQVAKSFLQEQKKRKVNEVVARVCADHFRAIYTLLAQGLMPSNKGHGYVLRKLMRRFLETVWSLVGNPISTAGLTQKLCVAFESSGLATGVARCDSVSGRIQEEETALLAILRRASEIIRQYPEASPQTLYNTYGISRTLLTLAQQNSNREKGGE